MHFWWKRWLHVSKVARSPRVKSSWHTLHSFVSVLARCRASMDTTGRSLRDTGRDRSRGGEAEECDSEGQPSSWRYRAKPLRFFKDKV